MLQMTGGACQPVLDVFCVFMAVRMAVAVRIVVVWMRMVVRRNLFQFVAVHVHHRLSLFVFYKISRRPASLSKDDFFQLQKNVTSGGPYRGKYGGLRRFGANAREILAL